MEILNKIFVGIFCIFLIGAIMIAGIYGAYIKNSFQDDVEYEEYLKTKDLKVQFHPYPYDENYDMYGGREKIYNFSDLQKEADVIVKLRLNPDFQRKIFRECIFSEADILKCYRGKIKEGEKIHLFEPVNCTGFGNPMLSEEGYSPMIENEEYIMFLKKVKNSYFSKDQYVYLPVSLTYGKYKADKSMPRLFKEDEIGTDVDDINTLPQYSEVKNQEVFLYEKKSYDLFVCLKDQVLKKYR